MKTEKIVNLAMLVVGVIAAVGIGGLFIAGGFMNVILLKLLPLVVHQVVGWVIIVTTLISAILGITKAL